MLRKGSFIRSISRVVNVSINTAFKPLLETGKVCGLPDKRVRGLQSKRIQCGKTWPFTYAKQKSVEIAKKTSAEAGDILACTALDADSKLIVSWLVDGRDNEYGLAVAERNRYLAEHRRARSGVAEARIGKLAEKLRVESRVALSEDGREIRLERRKQEVAEIARLDGCHALKINLGREIADKDLVHRRCKDLVPRVRQRTLQSPGKLFEFQKSK